MPNSTLETQPVETLPIAESFEFQEFSLDDQQPQVNTLAAQAVVGQEVVAIPVTNIEQQIGILAKRAAIERLMSQRARRDKDPDGMPVDSMPVDHDANESFFAGKNFTSHNLILENKFRTAVEEQYAILKNSNR